MNPQPSKPDTIGTLLRRTFLNDYLRSCGLDVCPAVINGRLIPHVIVARREVKH